MHLRVGLAVADAVWMKLRMFIHRSGLGMETG
jgi:hypothetical protein